MEIDALGRDRLRVVHGVAGQRQQVDAAPFQRPLRVEAGQQQEVLDEQAHAPRLALDAAHQHLDVAGGALAVQLGEAADRGQRRAQLVAGVGDEPPHPVLGRTRLLRRRLRRRDGTLDLREHSVERQRQSADLGSRSRAAGCVGRARRRRSPPRSAPPRRAVSGCGARRRNRRCRAPAAPRRRCRPATTAARAPSTTRRRGRWRRWSAHRAGRAPSSRATARRNGRSDPTVTGTGPTSLLSGSAGSASRSLTAIQMRPSGSMPRT